MRRGDLYLVAKPGGSDPKRQQVYAVVSRQVLIASSYSSVICVPVYTRFGGLETQVPVGVDEGLKHDSSINCDELVSFPKSKLTNFVGHLSKQKLTELNEALKIALELDE
jgi:mRNA interferase MazF